MCRCWTAKTIAAFLALGCAVGIFADSRVRIVRISFLEHTVEVSHTSPAQWEPALLNAPVVESEMIRTGAGARAEIQLECGSALRLAPSSAFAFTKLRLRDDGIRSTTIAFHRGTALISLRRADSPDFHIQLPNAEISTPDGPAILRLDAPPSAPTIVALLDGHATLLWRGLRYPLAKSRQWALASSGPPVSQPAAPSDRFTQWSHERDQAFQRAVLADQPKPSVDAAAGAAASLAIIQPSAAPPPPSLNGNVFATLDPSGGADPFPLATPQKVPFCANN